MKYWDQKDHPITRFYQYLLSKGAWSEAQEKEWKNESKKKVGTNIKHMVHCKELIKFYLPVVRG